MLACWKGILYSICLVPLEDAYSITFSSVNAGSTFLIYQGIQRRVGTNKNLINY